MQFGSGIAMAVVQAGSYSSNWTSCLETSICLRYGHKKQIIIIIIIIIINILNTKSSHYGVVEMSPTSIHEVAGSIPGLTKWVGDLALL